MRKRLNIGKLSSKNMNTNEQDRRWFIEFWAEYIKTHDDKDWSSQQKEIVDALISW